jgi:hypothetical protein
VERLRGKLTYANVMATLAVFIALGGGAYALSRGEVKSKHIKKDAVKAKHIDFGVRSVPMLATFNALEAGTGFHDFAPTGVSGTNTGFSNESVTPEKFVATGLRVRLLSTLAAGSREFIFRYYDGADHDTPLRCSVDAGERECQSNARVTVPAGSDVWFRVRANATSENDDIAEVGWRAVLP